MLFLENIKGTDRTKPVCYDPKRKIFILLDDLIDHKEKIIPIEKLNKEDIKKLVIERLRSGPDFTMGDLNGIMKNRDQIVQDVRAGSKFGKMILNSEVSYLNDLISELRKIV